MRKLFFTAAASLATTPAFAEADVNGGDYESALTGLIVILALYALPSIVAFSRRHHQAWAILTLNLGLGWTLVGWIGALVWANTAVKRRDAEGLIG